MKSSITPARPKKKKKTQKKKKKDSMLKRKQINVMEHGSHWTKEKKRTINSPERTTSRPDPR